MASPAASHTQARTSAQTTSGTRGRKETAPVFARRLLSDDLTVRETQCGATATGGADEAQRGPARGLSVKPGICYHAQRTPGGGLGLLAQARQRVSCE